MHCPKPSTCAKTCRRAQHYSGPTIALFAVALGTAPWWSTSGTDDMFATIAYFLATSLLHSSMFIALILGGRFLSMYLARSKAAKMQRHDRVKRYSPIWWSEVIVAIAMSVVLHGIAMTAYRHASITIWREVISPLLSLLGCWFVVIHHAYKVRLALIAKERHSTCRHLRRETPGTSGDGFSLSERELGRAVAKVGRKGLLAMGCAIAFYGGLRTLSAAQIGRCTNGGSLAIPFVWPRAVDPANVAKETKSALISWTQHFASGHDVSPLLGAKNPVRGAAWFALGSHPPVISVLRAASPFIYPYAPAQEAWITGDYLWMWIGRHGKHVIIRAAWKLASFECVIASSVGCAAYAAVAVIGVHPRRVASGPEQHAAGGIDSASYQ